MQWMIAPFFRWRDFKGRSRRREYWLFTALMLCLFVLVSLIESSLGLQIKTDEGKDGPGYLSMGVWLLVLIPWFAVQLRRFHDIGLSGWCILVSLLPYIGLLLVIYYMAKDGMRGANIYGEDPKSRPRHDVFVD